MPCTFGSRALFPPHCYNAYDAVRLCMMQKLDHDTCTEVYAAFSPCADEMVSMRAAGQRRMDEQERVARLQEAAAKAKS